MFYLLYISFRHRCTNQFDQLLWQFCTLQFLHCYNRQNKQENEKTEEKDGSHVHHILHCQNSCTKIVCKLRALDFSFLNEITLLHHAIAIFFLFFLSALSMHYVLIVHLSMSKVMSHYFAVISCIFTLALNNHNKIGAAILVHVPTS